MNLLLMLIYLWKFPKNDQEKSLFEKRSRVYIGTLSSVFGKRVSILLCLISIREILDCYTIYILRQKNLWKNSQNLKSQKLYFFRRLKNLRFRK